MIDRKHAAALSAGALFLLLGIPAAAQGTTGLAVTVVPSLGSGNLLAVPSGSTAGTPLSCAAGVRWYLSGSQSVTFTINAVAPTGAPAATFTVSATSPAPYFEEPLATSTRVYVTAISGSPLYRCL